VHYFSLVYITGVISSMLKIILFFSPIAVLSIYTTLCVFYPKIRASWRGQTQPIGTMSAVGAALFCDGAALIVLAAAFLPASVMNWLVPCLLGMSGTGFVLAVLGSLCDTGPT
jgi:hypothetical protein